MRELALTAAIVVVLALVAVPAFTAMQEQARRDGLIADVEMILTGVIATSAAGGEPAVSCGSSALAESSLEAGEPRWSEPDCWSRLPWVPTGGEGAYWIVAEGEAVTVYGIGPWGEVVRSRGGVGLR